MRLLRKARIELFVPLLSLVLARVKANSIEQASPFEYVLRGFG